MLVAEEAVVVAEAGDEEPALKLVEAQQVPAEEVPVVQAGNSDEYAKYGRHFVAPF